MRNLNTKALKSKGHKLLDEYIRLDTSNLPDREKRTNAYRELRKRMKKFDWKHHFAQLNNETHLRHAIMHLELMIEHYPKPNSKTQKQKKYEKELKELNRSVSQEEIKKAISQLNNKPPLFRRVLIGIKKLLRTSFTNY